MAYIIKKHFYAFFVISESVFLKKIIEKKIYVSKSAASGEMDNCKKNFMIWGNVLPNCSASCDTQ